MRWPLRAVAWQAQTRATRTPAELIARTMPAPPQLSQTSLIAITSVAQMPGDDDGVVSANVEDAGGAEGGGVHPTDAEVLVYAYGRR
jgi:hypothetical protein